MEEKNRDYITPEYFGAIGDGITDDYEAIQQCFNYASNIKGTEKPEIKFSSGKTYIISKELIIGGPNCDNLYFKLDGNESTIKILPKEENQNILRFYKGSKLMNIKNIWLFGTKYLKNTTSLHGIFMEEDVTDGYFSYVRIRYCDGDCVRVSNGAYAHIWTNCIFGWSNGNGYTGFSSKSFGGLTTTIFDSCHFVNNEGAGICGNGGMCVVKGGYIEGCKYAIKGVASVTNGLNAIELYGVDCENNYQSIYIDNKEFGSNNVHFTIRIVGGQVGNRDYGDNSLIYINSHEQTTPYFYQAPLSNIYLKLDTSLYLPKVSYIINGMEDEYYCKSLPNTDNKIEIYSDKYCKTLVKDIYLENKKGKYFINDKNVSIFTPKTYIIDSAADFLIIRGKMSSSYQENINHKKINFMSGESFTNCSNKEIHKDYIYGNRMFEDNKDFIKINKGENIRISLPGVWYFKSSVSDGAIKVETKKEIKNSSNISIVLPQQERIEKYQGIDYIGGVQFTFSGLYKNFYIENNSDEDILVDKILCSGIVVNDYYNDFSNLRTETGMDSVILKLVDVQRGPKIAEDYTIIAGDKGLGDYNEETNKYEIILTNNEFPIKIELDNRLLPGESLNYLDSKIIEEEGYDSIDFGDLQYNVVSESKGTFQVKDFLNIYDIKKEDIIQIEYLSPSAYGIISSQLKDKVYDTYFLNGNLYFKISNCKTIEDVKKLLTGKKIVYKTKQKKEKNILPDLKLNSGANYITCNTIDIPKEFSVTYKWIK